MLSPDPPILRVIFVSLSTLKQINICMTNKEEAVEFNNLTSVKDFNHFKSFIPLPGYSQHCCEKGWPLLLLINQWASGQGERKSTTNAHLTAWDTAQSSLHFPIGTLTLAAILVLRGAGGRPSVIFALFLLHSCFDSDARVFHFLNKLHHYWENFHL